MSVQMMGAVIANGPRDRTQFSILLALANYCDVFGFGFPSLATLAFDSRCDDRTTRRQVTELERQGWLHVARKVLNGKSNVYMLNLERLGVTVPGEAKLSPLFLRLIKRSPVAMTPIFSPRESPGTEEFSGDNPQGVTGHPVPSHRAPRPKIPGIACPPNRYEPSEEPSETVRRSRTIPPTPQGGCETLEPGVTAPTLPKCGPKAAAAWERLKNALRLDLGGPLLPGAVARRFTAVADGLPAAGPEIAPGRATIREGMSDYDLCFAAWWLEDVRSARGGCVFVTRAFDEDATEAGLAKYAGRIERLVRSYFPVARTMSVRIVVERPPGAPEALAEQAASP